MSELRSVARLVEGKVESRRLRVELSTRPLRLAFVIRDDLPLTHLTQILEYNSVVWGGYYNCLIPTDGERIEKEWWENLMRHSPDKVVFCGDKGQPVVSPELFKAVKDEIQPFSLHKWDQWGEDVVDFHKGVDQDQIGSMPIWYLLKHLADNLREPIEYGQSNVRIPAIGRDHPFYACIVAQVGIAKDLYKEGLTQSFKAEHVEFNSSDLEEYLDQLAKFDGRVHPLSLTHQHLGLNFMLEWTGRPEGLSIILIGDNWVQDICLFWNLRLAPSLTDFGKSYKELLLPINSLRSSRNLQALASACANGGFWPTRNINLLSKSVGKKRLRALADRLRRESRAGIRIEVLPSMPPIAGFRVHSTNERDEIRVENNVYSLKRPLPEYGDIVKVGEWVVDIDLKDRSNRSYEFPLSSKLNHLLCGAPSGDQIRWTKGYWIRYAHDRLACRVTQQSSFVNGHLVKATDAFQAVFEDRGFSTKPSDRCPYAEGFVKLMGNHSKLLEKVGVRDLFWQMQSGKAFIFDDMASILQLGQACDAVIDKLVQSRILLRGMSFRCEACGLLRWYPINEISEAMQCAGCLESIRPPVRAPISFKLNELVARAVGHGSIPVVLTHRFLSMRTIKHSLALFGLEVTEGGQRTDIDFMTTYQDHLLLAECKEFKNGAGPKQIRETVRQLSNLVKVATDVGAPIVLLSTLLPDTPPELAERVLRLNRGRKVAVHLVALKEMKFVNLRNPTAMVEFKGVNLFYPPTI